MPVILAVHSSNEMYGADRMLLEVLKSVPRRDGIAVKVWLPDDVTPTAAGLDQHFESLGVPYEVTTFPVLRRSYMKPEGLPGLIARVVRAAGRLRRERPTVVYCATSATLLIAPLARLLGVRTVILHAQELWSGPEATILGALATFCTDIVAISGAVKESLPTRIQERTVVVPNGVERTAASEPAATREGPLHFLMAGRWNRWKGHQTLLEAWDTEVPLGHLTILGGPPPSGEAADVPAMVERLRNPSSVTIVGEVPDIAPYIAQNDVMVVPSDDPEPFGLVAIEAFAQGRPVVASNAGGLAEIVKDQRTGLVFAPRSPADLRIALENLTPQLVAEMGERAKKDYEDRFTSEVFRARFSEIWARILFRP